MTPFVALSSILVYLKWLLPCPTPGTIRTNLAFWSRPTLTSRGLEHESGGKSLRGHKQDAPPKEESVLSAVPQTLFLAVIWPRSQVGEREIHLLWVQQAVLTDSSTNTLLMCPAKHFSRLPSPIPRERSD